MIRCTVTRKGGSSTATTADCYLPLYDLLWQHLLCARLRPADRDASAGSIDELQRIVGWIRARWPKTRIVIRGDSGFCREAIIAWCEANDVGYVLGLARNKRLERRWAKRWKRPAWLVSVPERRPGALATSVTARASLGPVNAG